MNEKTSEATTPYHWAWAALLALISLATLAFRYAQPVRDGDLWWHLVYGRYFLENRTIVADHTLFSWTPSTNDTIYCTWLPDIFLYLLHQWAGLPGLFAFCYACFLLLLAACILFARKLKIASHPVVWLIALTAILMSYTAAFLKPEIISFVLMTLTVWCWFHLRANGEKGWGWSYLFPIIMLVWVNSHGGFVFGAAFLVLAASGEVLNTWFSHGNKLPPVCRRHLARALFLTAVTPFLTPYGASYPAQLFFELLPTQANMAYNMKISAYYAPFTSYTPYQDFALYADIALGLLLILYLLNFMEKRVEWSSLLTNLFFAILYTKFLRTTFFWAPVFALSGISMVPYAAMPSHWHKVKRVFTRFLALPPIVLIGALLLSTHTLYLTLCRPSPHSWMGFGEGYMNPQEEAAYLKKYFPTRRIGNTYTEGGYLLWILWPENKVFFDPRHFPYKNWSDDYFDNMYRNDLVGFEKFIQRWPCDLWCINYENQTQLLFFTQSPDWQLAYYGKNSVVFARKDIALPEGVARVSPDIGQVKNMYNAFSILAFATTIQDWVTTDTLLGVIQNNFRCGDSKYLYPCAIALRDGMKAYWTGKYSKAILLFQALPPQLNTNPTPPYLLDSYQNLMEQAWQHNDDEAALFLAAKVWSLTEKNLYAVYNLGVIGWYFSKIHPEAKQKKNEAPDRWRHHLESFLEKTGGNPEFEAMRVIAQQILTGQFPIQTKPGLMVPEKRVTTATESGADNVTNNVTD